MPNCLIRIFPFIDVDFVPPLTLVLSRKGTSLKAEKNQSFLACWQKKGPKGVLFIFNH